MPPDPRGQTLPPEIASLSRDEFRAVYDRATAVVFGFTKSKPRTEELLQAASVLLLTTRRWDPDKGPLLQHVLGIVRSVLSHSYSREKTERGERAAQTREGFQREVAGTEAPSPEDATIDGTDGADRQAAAERELDELAASVADHPDAPRVLRLRRASERKRKASEIARELGLPVERVYRANDVLLRHLRRIRAQPPERPSVGPSPKRTRPDEDTEVDS
jgi:DNA-directed RNA polymerase specialized sigma24 family protein